MAVFKTSSILAEKGTCHMTRDTITALREGFGATAQQRCWVHKTGNVLNAMPK